MALKRLRKTLLIGLPILLIIVVLGALALLLKNANILGNSREAQFLGSLLLTGGFIFIVFCMAVVGIFNDNKDGYGRRQARNLDYDDDEEFGPGSYRTEGDPFAGREGRSWYYWWW